MPVMVGVMVPRTRSPVPEGSAVTLALVSVVVEFGARFAMPSRWRVRIEGLAVSPVHRSAVKAEDDSVNNTVARLAQAREEMVDFMMGKVTGNG